MEMVLHGKVVGSHNNKNQKLWVVTHRCNFKIAHVFEVLWTELPLNSL